MHGGGTGELDELLGKLNRSREEEGTNGDDYKNHSTSLDAFTVDGIKSTESKGATDLI